MIGESELFAIQLLGAADTAPKRIIPFFALRIRDCSPHFTFSLSMVVFATFNPVSKWLDASASASSKTNRHTENAKLYLHAVVLEAIVPSPGIPGPTAVLILATI